MTSQLPLIRIAFAAAALVLGPAAFGQNKTAGGFKIYDAFRYPGKPERFEGLPIQPIHIMYSAVIFPKESDRKEPPAEDFLVAAAKSLPSLDAPVVIDIENWPVHHWGDAVLSDSDRADSVRKLTFIARALRNARPDLKFGFYSILPGREYDAAVDDRRFKQIAKEWQDSNKRLRKDLALEVDAVFPSLYTYIANPSDWDRYAAENIREARKYGKPVFAFIWPRYHEDSKGGIGLQRIPDKDWRRQLDTCRRHADGVVIWDYAKDKEAWDPEAGWWKQTIEFMKALPSR